MKHTIVTLLWCVLIGVPPAWGMHAGTAWDQLSWDESEEERKYAVQQKIEENITLRLRGRSMPLLPPSAPAAASSCSHPAAGSEVSDLTPTAVPHVAILTGDLTGDIVQVRTRLWAIGDRLGAFIEDLSLTIPNARPIIVHDVFKILESDFPRLRKLSIACEAAPQETVWNMMRQVGVLGVHAGMTTEAIQKIMRLGLSDRALEEVGAQGRFYNLNPSRASPFLYAPTFTLESSAPFRWQETEANLFMTLSRMACLTKYQPIGGRWQKNEA